MKRLMVVALLMIVVGSAYASINEGNETLQSDAQYKDPNAVESQRTDQSYYCDGCVNKQNGSW